MIELDRCPVPLAVQHRARLPLQALRQATEREWLASVHIAPRRHGDAFTLSSVNLLLQPLEGERRVLAVLSAHRRQQQHTEQEPEDA